MYSIMHCLNSSKVISPEVLSLDLYLTIMLKDSSLPILVMPRRRRSWINSWCEMSPLPSTSTSLKADSTFWSFFLRARAKAFFCHSLTLGVSGRLRTRSDLGWMRAPTLLLNCKNNSAGGGPQGGGKEREEA